MGRRYADADARSYQDLKPVLRDAVLDALADLRARYDVVVCEGAGSPAEINLRAGDLANMGLARAADIPVLLVGDIDRGGVFASLYGSLALLEPDDQALVAGFVINKFRGDDTILAPGLEQLMALTGRPTLGVLPWLEGCGSTPRTRWRSRRPAPEAAAASGGDTLEVAVDPAALDEQLHGRRRAHRRARGQRPLHALARRRRACRPRARAGDEGDGRGPRAPARRRPRRGPGPPRGRRAIRSSASAAATRCSARRSRTRSRAAAGRWPASGCCRSARASPPDKRLRRVDRHGRAGRQARPPPATRSATESRRATAARR